MTGTRRAAALLAGTLALAAVSTAGAAVSREKLNELVAKLRANGELWAKDEDIPTAQKVDLKNVTFDKASVSALLGVLPSLQRDTAGLYAAGKLLGRLAESDKEAIGAAVPAVRSLQARAKSGYRPFPRLSRAQASSLKMPDYSGRMTTDAIMSRLAALERQRSAKVDRDLPIAKHNVACCRVEKQAYRIMFRADNPREDVYLIRQMFLAENDGDAMFLHIINLIDKGAQDMADDRARRYQAAFRPHLARLKMKNRTGYTDRCQPNLRSDDVSGYLKDEAYAGVKVLSTYKKLLKAAGMDKQVKVQVPTEQQVKAFHEKKRKRK